MSKLLSKVVNYRAMRHRLVTIAVGTMLAFAVVGPVGAQQRSHDSFAGPNEPEGRLSQIEASADTAGAPAGAWRRRQQALYDATGLKFGAAFAHVFQGASNVIEGEDNSGEATTFTGIAKWDLLHRGLPTQGGIVAQVESRWDYGGIGAEDVGFISLASAVGTADTYSRYPVGFVLRNLNWSQGSPDAGWIFRIGKISPDALLSTSEYLDSQTTFLPSAGVGANAIGFSDSGLGAAGALYFLDKRVAFGGVIADANGDRFNFGDISAGDYFKAVEIQAKIAPRTDDAPYSKLTFWHTDGTKDGMAINAQLGPSGWGVFALHQQELTADGRLVGILRYGRSFEGAAAYKQQAAVHFILKQTGIFPRLANDALGFAFNWAESPAVDARNESNVEVFYRFPLTRTLDASLSYQSVINPAFTRDLDHASVFSFRLRKVIY